MEGGRQQEKRHEWDMKSRLPLIILSQRRAQAQAGAFVSPQMKLSWDRGDACQSLTELVSFTVSTTSPAGRPLGRPRYSV